MKKLLIIALAFTSCATRYVTTVQDKVVTGYNKNGLPVTKAIGKPVVKQFAIGDTIKLITRQKLFCI